jgi:hypothetical protein
MKSEIAATNNALIDRSKVEKSTTLSIDKNGRLVDTKIPLSEEEIKKRREKEELKKMIRDETLANQDIF